MHALYYQTRSTRTARLFTAVIVLAAIAIVSGVLGVWLDYNGHAPAIEQIRAAVATSGALTHVLQPGSDTVLSRRPEAGPQALLRTLDREIDAIVLPERPALGRQPDQPSAMYRQLLSDWHNEIKPLLEAYVGTLGAPLVDRNLIAFAYQRDGPPPSKPLQGLTILRGDLALLNLMLHERASSPWSIPNAIQFVALFALLVTAVLLRRADTRPDSKPQQIKPEDTLPAPTGEPAARDDASPREEPTHLGASLALLQTVLARFVDNPESPESFLLLLREIERLIDAKCSAIFITKESGTDTWPLVCTDPSERDCFVALLEERMPPSSLNGSESIQTFIDPAHPATHIIVIQLAASDGLEKGVLLIKRQFALTLSTAETGLLNGLGKHLAAVICSVQRAQLNRRVALCEERAVIARELHDSLAQSLSYLKIQTGRLQSLLHSDKGQQAFDYEDADAVLQELRTNLNLAYRQLRELITTFRLTMNGRSLDQALKDSVEEFENRSSLAFTLDNRLPDGLLSIDEEMHVLQIVRECVGNIVRHAHAKRAEVLLYKDSSGIVRVMVDDNGIGMREPSSFDLHYGLVIMQQRAHALGGDMRVQRSPDGGTRVHVSFTPRRLNSGSEQVNPATDQTLP
jgi:signal transduction histidine kinase